MEPRESSPTNPFHWSQPPICGEILRDILQNCQLRIVNPRIKRKKKTGAKKYTCPWCLSPFKNKLKILKNMQLGRMLSTNHWSQGFFLPLFKLTKSLAIWKNRWHLNQHKKKAHFLPSFSLPDFTSIVGWLPATMKSWRWCQIQGQASSNARWQYWQGCNLATFRTAVAPVFLARFFCFVFWRLCVCFCWLVGWLVRWLVGMSVLGWGWWFPWPNNQPTISPPGCSLHSQTRGPRCSYLPRFLTRLVCKKACLQQGDFFIH